MNKKLAFMLGFVFVLVIAFAFSSVSAKWFGKKDVQLSPEINAHDCAADDKCVMKNAVVKGSVESVTGTIQSLQGQSLKMIDLSDSNSLFAGRVDTKGITFAMFLNPRDRVSFSGPADKVAGFGSFGVEVISSLYPGTGNGARTRAEYESDGVSGYTRLNLTSLDESAFILSSNAILSRYLNGNGTAYACIDSTGKLFRSTTPCR